MKGFAKFLKKTSTITTTKLVSINYQQLSMYAWFIKKN